MDYTWNMDAHLCSASVCFKHFAHTQPMKLLTEVSGLFARYLACQSRREAAEISYLKYEGETSWRDGEMSRQDVM